MRRIEVISSTMGQSSPATIAEGAGYYKFRKDPNWPYDRSAYEADPEPGVAPRGFKGSKERKQERLKRFADALRDLGTDPWAATGTAVIRAAESVGVSYDTARSYRNELRQQSVQDWEAGYA